MKNYIMPIMGWSPNGGGPTIFYFFKKKQKFLKLKKIYIYGSHASVDMALTLHRADVTLLHRYLSDNMVRR
jgi:hypothetical protein